MSGRTLILMIVALAIAIATAVVVKNRSQSSEESSVKVLVATSDISAGSFVRADKDLAWVDWPQAQVSPSFITSDAHKIEEYNGGVARRTILTGEPVTVISVVRANEGGFMAAVLTPGKRAVSIAVNSTSGNAGFIFPGDHVDLLLTHRIPVKDSSGSSNDVLASETFIQDVRVLAIDQMLDNPENKAVVAKTITLEVMPKQAEMINVAESLGAISVSLRSLGAASVSNSGKQNITGSAASMRQSPAQPQTPGSLPAPIVTGMPRPEISAPPVPANSETLPATGNNYSTGTDVSKLMGDKNSVRSKVSVYHGSTTEQIDFHQGSK